MNVHIYYPDGSVTMHDRPDAETALCVAVQWVYFPTGAFPFHDDEDRHDPESQLARMNRVRLALRHIIRRDGDRLMIGDYWCYEDGRMDNKDRKLRRYAIATGDGNDGTTYDTYIDAYDMSSAKDWALNHYFKKEYHDEVDVDGDDTITYLTVDHDCACGYNGPNEQGDTDEDGNEYDPDENPRPECICNWDYAAYIVEVYDTMAGHYKGPYGGDLEDYDAYPVQSIYEEDAA